MFTIYGLGRKPKKVKAVVDFVPQKHEVRMVEIPILYDDMADQFHQQAEHAFYNQGGQMRECDYCSEYYPFFPYGIRRYTCFDPACEQRYLNRVIDEHDSRRKLEEEQERRYAERQRKAEQRQDEREKERAERERQEYLDAIETGEKHGYVYLLASENGYYKIGRSIDVEKRLCDLQRKFPIRIDYVHKFASQDYFLAEKVLHERFNEQRMAHEWFKLSQEQVDWLMGIKNYDLDPYIIGGEDSFPF